MVNSIPKSVVRLENFYDFQDKFKNTVNCKTNSSSLSYEKVNLGTNENPQCINLGLGCSQQEKAAFIKLFKEFKKFIRLMEYIWFLFFQYICHKLLEDCDHFSTN